MTGLQGKKKVVGAKETARALQDGRAAVVYVAEDADARVTAPVLALCEERGIKPVMVQSLAALGAACGVRAGAAVAAELKEQ
ncbi:MAG: 50S ribosomal protein L7ae-like protein [Clostridiales bacterium]|nr:50S ribosomal protein L7ae-like protein [Clostridiales bacterium]